MAQVVYNEAEFTLRPRPLAIYRGHTRLRQKARRRLDKVVHEFPPGIRSLVCGLPGADPRSTDGNIRRPKRGRGTGSSVVS